MVVLDTLAPAERLAFVLHDIFAMPFDEIAPIVERSPAATRQLASRARRRVRGVPPATDTDLARQRQVADAFLAALRQGDLTALIAVLDPDIVLLDVRAAPGAEPVRRGSRAVAGYALRYSRQARFVWPALVDGTPGLAIVLLGRVIGALGFTYRGDAIIEIEMIDISGRLRRDVAVSRDLRTSQPTRLQNDPVCLPQPICTSNQMPAQNAGQRAVIKRAWRNWPPLVCPSPRLLTDRMFICIGARWGECPVLPHSARAAELIEPAAGWRYDTLWITGGRRRAAGCGRTGSAAGRKAVPG